MKDSGPERYGWARRLERLRRHRESLEGVSVHRNHRQSNVTSLNYMEGEGDEPQERQVLVRAARIGARRLFGGLLELVRREVRRIGDGP